ncbi:restriction endonuclease [Devosia sp. 1635]|uniref:restriction endonuclease n=1 Tax=Devosia sp. 1635 TaxID=2726066 RepID=UPI00156612D2|nr:restriction endonuclease [Devosia sp. 1635]
MATLSTTDMKLIDSIFGMYSGYVLDFSNDRFASFFNRDLDIDIYLDRYAIHGGSKGKLFRGFLEISPNADVVRALTALWEYRETYRLDHNEDEKVLHARQRLSQLLVKLGGEPLPVGFDEPAPAAPPPPVKKGPGDQTLADLEQEFLALTMMNEAAQARGYAFERFLKRWFDAWGLDARASFKLVGEQIDGSFEHRGTVYLIEAKWTDAKTDAAALRSFQEKAGDGFEGTRGLFVSFSGFTDQGLVAFNAKRVILMDGMDAFDALRQRISLDDIVAAKFRRGTEERRPLIPVRELFP